MRDVTLTPFERVGAAAADAATGDTFMMDEDAFRVFYERTARSVWAYLARMTGDARAADDLLQEAYYRFLRARVVHEGDAHRRNYLFRIATNLARDERRRPPIQQVPEDQSAERPAAGAQDPQSQAAARMDLSRAMARLKPRERSLLWLAYARGSSHREIAEALGLKTGSVKPLLFRARQRLAGFLRGDRR
jgi:RNA polymerase sigma-70 factor (ECF subfamily)